MGQENDRGFKYCAFKLPTGESCNQRPESCYRIGKIEGKEGRTRIEYYCRKHYGMLQYQLDPIFKKICDDARNAIREGVIYPGKVGGNSNDRGQP